MTGSSNADTTTPRANLALGLGIAAVAAQIVAMIANGDGDKYGWMWFVMAALGLAAVATGWTARQDGHFPARALIGMAIGAAVVVLFALFASGILS